ncbi:MAG: hypothetical protein Unbinned3891contig1000_85 [Prokaryotic dsDNA virus sp.]|nr:MAG: hypothetical protein Unbinned3891contig1000_85 [Prokaryotic dsDNA virus sp.]|tara:strand:- start:43437 stop:43868 length:432 start_codon:yes stop_codon:yes gene_type:complete
MAQLGTIVGIEKVIGNLRRREKVMSSGVERGLKLAGLHLQRASQQRVPVDLGNLKASAFTRARGKGFRTEVNIGYTAHYALHVHELTAMKLKGLPRTGKRADGSKRRGFYWDPQGKGSAKFLEIPGQLEAKAMRAIIRKWAKI